MSIDDVMKDLRKDYIEAFPFKIEELKKKIQAKDKDAVINLFHQIKGSGKTYGFQDLSATAERAEHQIPKASEWMKEANNHLQSLEKLYEDLARQAA